MKITIIFFFTLIMLVSSSFGSENFCKLYVTNFTDNRGYFDRDEGTQKAIIASSILSYGIDAAVVENGTEIPENSFVMDGVIDYLDSSFGHLNPGVVTDVVLSKKTENGIIEIARGTGINFSRFIFENAGTLECRNGQVEIRSLSLAK